MAITLVQSLSVSPNASPIIKAFTSNTVFSNMCLGNNAINTGNTVTQITLQSRDGIALLT